MSYEENSEKNNRCAGQLWNARRKRREDKVICEKGQRENVGFGAVWSFMDERGKYKAEARKK